MRMRRTQSATLDAVEQEVPPPQRPLPYWLRFVLTCVVCNVLILVSHQLPSSNPILKVVWLPAGVALASVWLWGYSMLPAVALAAFVPPPFTHFVFTGALSGTIGAVTEIATAVWLLRLCRIHPAFERVRDVLGFSLIALVISPITGGMVGSFSLQILRFVPAGHFDANALSWWIGDAGGIVMLSPLLLLLGREIQRKELLRRWRELALLLACWGLMDVWIARFSSIPGWDRYPLNTLLAPLLLWAALRFGPVGIAVLCPLAMVQGWALQPGGFHVLPGESLAAQIPYPLINIQVVWVTLLMLASVMDEARRIRMRLQRSTNALAELIDALPLAVVAIDANHRVREWNRAAETLFGGSRTERIGKPVPFAPEADLASRLTSLHEAAPLHGAEVHWRDARLGETRCLRLYSAPIHASSDSSPLALPSDGANTMVLIADVTAQREMEERMQRGERLERIGRLTGGISSDLQRLLDLIRREAEGITEESADVLVHDRAHEMQATVTRAFALIHQLQAFSQRQPVPAGTLDLNHAIRLLLPFLQRLAGPAVTIDTLLDPNPAMVALREPQAEQILLNLVVNARDAMPNGGSLQLATRTSPASNHDDAAIPQVQLIVTDTGCGMSPEVRARIFEPFFTTKAAGKGSGLGLATVYGIVQQAGGSIQLWSEPNVGTRFEILLPAAPGDLAAALS